MNGFFYWFGVLAFTLCALYGALEFGFWLVDRILKNLGLTKSFMRAAMKMIREDRAAREPAE